VDVQGRFRETDPRPLKFTESAIIFFRFPLGGGLSFLGGLCRPFRGCSLVALYACPESIHQFVGVTGRGLLGGCDRFFGTRKNLGDVGAASLRVLSKIRSMESLRDQDPDKVLHL
jgi:hypothetical protein